jgi:hypothetical protein
MGANRCGNPFDINNHVIAVHGGSKDFPCNLCDKYYAVNHQLQSHIKKFHNRIKDFQCDRCDKAFARKSDLKNHIHTVHDKFRDFTCDLCPNVYASKSKLSRHVAKHHLTYQAAKDFFSGHSLTIVTLNINALVIERKMNLFKNFIEDIGCPLVVCLSEIWRPQKPICLDLPGYNDPILHRRGGGVNGGGGLCIWTKIGVKVQKIQRSDTENVLEVMVLNITTGETSLTVVTIYRPPNMPLSQTWPQLENVFERLMCDQFGTLCPCVISGDFNIDMSVPGSGRGRSKYQALLDKHSPYSVHSASNTCFSTLSQRFSD